MIFFNEKLHFNFLLSSYLQFFFSYLYVHICSIIKNSEFCKYSVKENWENMDCWRYAWLSHKIREVASLITESTDCTGPTKFVWKTLRPPRMHIYIQFIKAKINFLIIHDVISNSCWFFFCASSSARRL